jgi:hypothetical protein
MKNKNCVLFFYFIFSIFYSDISAQGTIPSHLNKQDILNQTLRHLSDKQNQLNTVYVDSIIFNNNLFNPSKWTVEYDKDKVISFTSYYKENNNWINSYRYVFKYDSVGHLISRTRLIFNSGQWMPQYKDSLVFDHNGNETYNYFYSYHNGGWLNDFVL